MSLANQQRGPLRQDARQGVVSDGVPYVGRYAVLFGE